MLRGGRRGRGHGRRGPQVKRGPMVISVTQRGNLSAKNAEQVRNELEGRTTILSLVPEGSRVEEGDVIAELDVSETEDRRVQQEIAVQNAEAALVTPPQVTDLAVETYHQSMLRHAADSIGAVPAASRHVGAVTVSVPLELVPRLKREIAAFERHILNLCDQAEGERQAVYQLGVQLFPLTTEEGV